MVFKWWWNQKSKFSIFSQILKTDFDRKRPATDYEVINDVTGLFYFHFFYFSVKLVQENCKPPPPPRCFKEVDINLVLDGSRSLGTSTFEPPTLTDDPTLLNWLIRLIFRTKTIRKSEGLGCFSCSTIRNRSRQGIVFDRVRHKSSKYDQSSFANLHQHRFINIVLIINLMYCFENFKKARVGLVHFSTNVNDVFEMNQHGDIRSILSAIENLQYKDRHYDSSLINFWSKADAWSKTDVRTLDTRDRTSEKSSI